jgi:hypothetical protein
MKIVLKKRIIFADKTKRTPRLVLVMLAGLAVQSETARAQQVVTPPPTVSVTPPAMPETASGETQVFSTENPASTFLDEAQPLQWGPVTLRPHVFYQFAYATGLLSSGNKPNDTFIQSLAPGMLFVLTPRWTLDYTPTLIFYSNENFGDNVGQSVTLTGGTTYESWVFGFSQNFTYSSSPEVQTGTQTSQDTVNTALTASCPLNSKISVDLGIYQDLNFPTDFQRTLEWSTLDWLNYEFWPRLVVGVGAGAGYIDSTPNMVFEQIQGRVNWRATDKTSFQLSGGGQFSQFTDSGAAPLVNPIFQGTIQYQPFKYTQISVNGGEQVNTSYFQNQVNVVTSVGANLSQRLQEKFYLNVSGSYDWDNYIAAVNGMNANSPVNYYSINVNLSTTLSKRLTASIFYTYNESITSQTGLAFSSNQVGFNVGFKY